MSNTKPLKFTKEQLASIVSEQNELFARKDVGVQREILDKLKSTIKSPLITVITGLRRVGKSTLLAQISKKYLKDDFYFLTFEDERLLNFTVNDFDMLHEVFIRLFGKKEIFLFDEIQNINGWERFVRRLHDQGYKFIVTGSNASLLSQELGTRLTGRSIQVELYPFSFREFLNLRNIEIPNLKALTTHDRGMLLRNVNKYINDGGMPDALKYPDLNLHKNLYNDVLYRDIATRYQIENVMSLKELSFYLMSNISSLISFNKLKELLKLGSASTVKSYIDYLQYSWLFFIVNKYAYSVKEQQIAPKKIYGIDTGLARSIGFSFSDNKGKLLENVVFTHLKRINGTLYYYKTADGYEVDFFLPERKSFIQVVQNFDHEQVRVRELRSIVAAAKEQKGSVKLIIITESEKDLIKTEGVKIQVIPIYEWLLAN